MASGDLVGGGLKGCCGVKSIGTRAFYGIPAAGSADGVGSNASGLGG